ncbi:DUF397 domain-containing protein [Phytohabitans suffuscus]|uniref:DUF397 domain-containing protein n=1 Tax=Phytohabitans suffuscus TaxID=624315 RepID=A0A6F8YI70_9ACTN|nr:DUF397 domain-containing protein [Phytohabitans suffuscus]BCB85733.1 DUF397 domain-containing protein [Phytohabitans suffuscus]
MSDRTWRKSSRSGSGQDCVEIADVPAGVAVRDSKDATGPVLVFGVEQWWHFVAALKARDLA